jgi:para-aminobenzoate synthetase component 1
MELIAELEQSPRGIYTGSIGYLAGNGDFDFNIAIRTLVQMGELMEVQVGGAITSDSDPQKEYEETLHKAESLLKVLGNG